MSQRLSTSTTFQSLEARVLELEQVAPLPSTLENNSYLSARRHDGIVSRIAGIAASDTLYLGGIDAAVSAVVITAGGSSSIELKPVGTKVWGSLTVSDVAQAPVIVAPSATGLGGSIEILGSGVAGYTGIVQFHKLDGTRNGFIGFNAESGPMHYGSDTGAGHYFEGGVVSPDPNMRFGLRFNGTDGLIDFDTNDAFYFSRSGNTFIWTVGGTSRATLDGSGNLIAAGYIAPNSDTNFYLTSAGGLPYLAFDAGDTIAFNRSTNTYGFNIGGGSKLDVNATGITVPGSVNAGNFVQIGDANFFAQIISAKPTITFDSGDTISYDRTANKYYFAIGGVNVASIDASGNMRLKGTLTQSVTP